MTAAEIIELIGALPPGEREKVAAFLRGRPDAEGSAAAAANLPVPAPAEDPFEIIQRLNAGDATFRQVR